MPRDKLLDITRTYLPTGVAATLIVVSVTFFSSIQPTGEEEESGA